MAYRGKKNYYQHDDRGSGFSGRVVKFAPTRNRNNNRQRLRDDKFRKFMDDGDCEMTVKVNHNKASGMRYNPMAARRSLPIDLTHKLSKRAAWPTSPSSWYLVSLSHGKKYSRKDLMNAIHQYIRPVPFVPFNIKIEGDDMTFFVDNEDLAKAIYAANFKIQMPDGWKVQIKVRPCMPVVEMDNSLKQKIKVVMSSLFDANTQHLNLTKFHANDEFLKNDLFVPLNRQNMLLAVFEIIADSVPNLRSLNLSDNKIFATEHFVMLKRNTPDLKSLNLSKNKIRNLSSLSCLQGMKLETLFLDNNPVCNDFHDQTAYVRGGALDKYFLDPKGGKPCKTIDQITCKQYFAQAEVLMYEGGGSMHWFFFKELNVVHESHKNGKEDTQMPFLYLNYSLFKRSSMMV